VILYRAPFFLPLLYPTLEWRINTPEKVLYVTFDDGPVGGPTDFALSQLQRVKAKATFFCIGDNIMKRPDLFQKVLTSGHAVGNHTHNHIKGWGHSTAEYLKNTEQCARAMAENKPAGMAQEEWGKSLFRPPYGRITRDQIKAMLELRIIMWDVLTHDYAHSLSQENCLRGSIGATRPGSIIVFHDSLKAEKNMTYVLPRYLDHFSDLGYTFKTLHRNS
jgi:peptidoglycan/xylan/chitin deacetylase (PgdA/CDA1 family)